MPDFNADNQKKWDLHYMGLALKQAQVAESKGEVPVGALIVKNNEVISGSYNKKENGPSATYHAEVLAIDEASKKLGAWRLSGCTLYVSLEPCIMCAGAIISARIDRLVYGAKDPKAGAIDSVYHLASDNKLNHSFTVTSGVLESECSIILKDFFKSRR